MHDLRLDFAGEIHELKPGKDFSFGRSADLEIDTNRYLHRRLGLFRWLGGTWWLFNVGSAIALEVCDLHTPSRLLIVPGARAPLPFTHSAIRFQAGRSTYELEVTTQAVGPNGLVIDTDHGTPTATASDIPLNDEQRLLLTALAQIRLTDRAAPLSALPTNREVADQLGWTRTKFNRKLDYLCVKFGQLGVDGLKGDAATLAGNRRERLVDHVLMVGLVTADDLALLDGSGLNAKS